MTGTILPRKIYKMHEIDCGSFLKGCKQKKNPDHNNINDFIDLLIYKDRLNVVQSLQCNYFNSYV